MKIAATPNQGEEMQLTRTVRTLNPTEVKILDYVRARAGAVSFDVYSGLDYVFSAESVTAALRSLRNEGLLDEYVRNRPNYSHQGDATISSYTITQRGEFELHKSKVQGTIGSAENLEQLLKALRNATEATDIRVWEQNRDDVHALIQIE